MDNVTPVHKVESDSNMTDTLTVMETVENVTTIPEVESLMMICDTESSTPDTETLTLDIKTLTTTTGVLLVEVMDCEVNDCTDMEYWIVVLMVCI